MSAKTEVDWKFWSFICTYLVVVLGLGAIALLPALCSYYFSVDFEVEVATMFTALKKF